jgi:hypothetical protein
MNPFVIARVIGIDYVMPYEPGSNIPTKEWADWIADEIYNLWDEDAAAWASESFYSENTQSILRRYCEIEKQLITEPVGERRNELVSELFAIRSLNIDFKNGVRSEQKS